jgi:hypothetical protein
MAVDRGSTNAGCANARFDAGEALVAVILIEGWR